MQNCFQLKKGFVVIVTCQSVAGSIRLGMDLAYAHLGNALGPTTLGAYSYFSSQFVVYTVYNTGPKLSQKLHLPRNLRGFQSAPELKAYLLMLDCCFIAEWKYLPLS